MIKRLAPVVHVSYQRELAWAAFVLTTFVVAGCAELGNILNRKSAPTPVIAIVRGRLISAPEPTTLGASRYEVSEVLMSDLRLTKGTVIRVFALADDACLHGGAVVDDDQCWPSDAYLVLAQYAEDPDGSPVFQVVTSRWDKWILPVSGDSEVSVRSLTRDQVVGAYHKYAFLVARARRAEREAGRCAMSVPLPIGCDESHFPVVALLCRDARTRLGSDRIVVSIWETGKVVWSCDSVLGGPPYREGFVARDRIDAFLRALREKGLLGNGPMQTRSGGCVVDGAFYDFSIRSCVGALEWKTSHGLYGMQKRLEASPDIDEFLSAWEELRRSVLDLIPVTGVELHSYEYQVLRVGVSGNLER